MEQPKNYNDQKNRAKAASRIVAPVARVRIGGKGAEDEKQQNNDDDEHDVPPESDLQLLGRCSFVCFCYPDRRQERI